MSFIYIASPYTDQNPDVCAERFRMVSEFTADMINIGYVVYSPIAHSHPLAIKYDLPEDSESWRHQNYGMLAKASELWVLKLQGFDTSKGVTDEVKFAEMCNIPVLYKMPIEKQGEF